MEGNPKYMDDNFFTFTGDCSFFIAIEDNIFRKNFVIDIIPVQDDIRRALTDMTRDSIYNLAEISETDTEIEDESYLIDNRDQQVYHWINIQNQIWMVENLNIGTIVPERKKQENNKIIEKYCYDDKEDNCNTYGGLYQWNEAMDYNENPQGICPQGWHLPTVSEWESLIQAVGGNKTAGASLKERGAEHWKESEKYLAMVSEIPSSGFNALPGGLRSKTTNKFSAMGFIGFYRTSTNSSFYCLYDSEALIKHQTNDPVAGFSIRCIKD